LNRGGRLPAAAGQKTIGLHRKRAGTRANISDELCQKRQKFDHWRFVDAAVSQRG